MKINISKILVGVAGAAATVLVALLHMGGSPTQFSGGANPSNSDKAASTVMVMRLTGGGGTGTIISTSESESKILTNLHVCKAIAKGGAVVTDSGKKYAVVSYQMSAEHDLCLATVAAKIGPSARIAESAPEQYSEADISGHPHLMPTLITKGHFAGHQIIEVNTGMKPCTADDVDKLQKSGNLGGLLMCAILGGIPEFRSYDAQLVSATIQPGNSGSAVYNDKGEVAGVAFAGGGDLSYGWIVPHGAVLNFLNREIKTAPIVTIDTSASLTDLAAEGQVDDEKAQKYCDSKPEDKLGKEFCRAYGSDILEKGNEQ